MKKAMKNLGNKPFSDAECACWFSVGFSFFNPFGPRTDGRKRRAKWKLEVQNKWKWLLLNDIVYSQNSVFGNSLCTWICVIRKEEISHGGYYF